MHGPIPQLCYTTRVVAQFKMADLADVDLSGIPGAAGAEMLIGRLLREVNALRLEVGQLKALIKIPESFTRDEAERLLAKEDKSERGLTRSPRQVEAGAPPVRRIEPVRHRRTKKKPSSGQQQRQQRPIRITGSLD